jgi:hypothetical protein
MRYLSRKHVAFPTLIAITACFCLVSIRADSRASSASTFFEFHSGFWLNLHLTLYQQSQAAKADPAWAAAMAYYKANIASRNLLFDDMLVMVKDNLEAQELSRSLMPTKQLAAAWIAVLEETAPSYRANLWQKHDWANKQWIEHAALLVERHGSSLIRELPKIYQADWPPQPIRVDTAEYASWAGAYTTNDPTRITVSSTDAANQNDAALEVLFHEASHSISGKLERSISAACKQQNVLLPRRDLWHAVLFYTTGELMRREIPAYTPYATANGLWKRAWPMYLEPLERDWRPYLDGATSFDAATAAIVKDVGQKKP